MGGFHSSIDAHLTFFGRGKEHFNNFSSALDAASGGLGTSTCEITRTLFCYLVFPSLLLILLFIRLAFKSLWFFSRHLFLSLFSSSLPADDRMSHKCQYLLPMPSHSPSIDTRLFIRLPFHSSERHQLTCSSQPKRPQESLSACPLVRQFSTLHRPTQCLSLKDRYALLLLLACVFVAPLLNHASQSLEISCDEKCAHRLRLRLL